jgi:hypothetical protein
MPAPPVPTPTWRAHWPAAVLAVVAALVALWARHTLFPAFSWNRDEPVYLWQVDALRAGHLTPTDGGFPELFQPWLSARGDGVLFTQYTLGWPLALLAAAVATGAAGNALLLGAALAVVGTYALGVELWQDRRIATVAGALMVGSPILAIQGGAYLSYLFTLGLGLLFGAALLSGVRRGRPARLLAAGVLLGWIFLTRPYDAVLWGAAFAGFVVVRDRARWRTLVRPFVLTGLAALPLVVLALAYNRHVTGGWLKFPITAADPLDTFGFGRKRLMPSFEPVDYGLGKAVRATAKNAFVLPWFLVGTYVGLVTAGVGLWQRRRDVSTLALILLSAVFPLGYFVFWGNHLSSLAARISGPIYLIPIYAPLCLLIGSVLVGWWETRRRLAWALLAALMVATVPAAVSRFDVNRDISVQQAPWRDSVAGLRGEALVFVADTARYVLYMNPFSSNGPDLDDRILYAAGGSPSMLDLMAAMPQRTAYLQRASVPSQEVGPREDPYELQVSLTPVEVRSGPSLAVTVTLDPPAGASHASLRIQAGAVDVRRAVDLGADGVSTDRFVVGLPTSTDDTEIPLDERGAIRVTVGYGDSAAAAAGDPTARHTLQYRVVDGTIEVLLPSTEQRNVPVGRSHQWRHVVGLPELRIDVAP